MELVNYLLVELHKHDGEMYFVSGLLADNDRSKNYLNSYLYGS